MSKLSNLRSSLRAAGRLIPRSIAIALLASMPVQYSGELMGGRRGERGMKKYRAWRKMRRKMRQASQRANRNK